MSRSSDGDGNSGDKSTAGKSPTSAKRKRLHLLYVLHDVLHHTKYHAPDSTSFSTFSSGSQGSLVDLIGLAASSDNKKIQARLADLLRIWEEDAFYSLDYVRKLREAVAHAAVEEPSRSEGAQNGSVQASDGVTGGKERPFLMPATHGDPSTPYYDLPAGNMMPHIVPNSSNLIKPELVKPLRFLAGPADENLVSAVKDFFKEVDRIYKPEIAERDEGTVTDVDELGQTVIRDEITGEVSGGDSYYGWSQAFCEKMRRRDGDTQGKARARSDSSSRSRSPRKRRRYSESPSSRSRSYSRSRSRSSRRPRYRNGHSNESRSPRDRSRRRGLSYSRSRSRSRSHSYSPKPASTLRQPPPPPPAPVPALGQSPPPPPPIPYGASPGHHTFPPPPAVGSGRGMPVPPPRPPNYNGPWPPPPPPPPPVGMNMNFNSQSGFQYGASPSPPLPFQPGGTLVPPPPNGRGDWGGLQRGGSSGSGSRGGWHR